MKDKDNKISYLNENEKTLEEALATQTSLKNLYAPHEDAEAAEAARAEVLLDKRSKLVKALTKLLRAARDYIDALLGQIKVKDYRIESSEKNIEELKKSSSSQNDLISTLTQTTADLRDDVAKLSRGVAERDSAIVALQAEKTAANSTIANQVEKIRLQSELIAAQAIEIRSLKRRRLWKSVALAVGTAASGALASGLMVLNHLGPFAHWP
jgi:chromosome segregation ATPase